MIVLSLLFSVVLSAQATVSPFDSMDLVVAKAIAPHLAEAENPCRLTSQVSVYPLKFDHGTFAVIQTSETLSNAKLFDSSKKRVTKSLGKLRDMTLVGLPETGELSLVADNPCARSVEIATLPDPSVAENAAIDVSKAMFAAIGEWQNLNEKRAVPLEVFLDDQRDLDFIEKLFVLQRTVFQGKPYPTKFYKKLQRLRTDKSLLNSQPLPAERLEGKKTKSNCSCQTLRLSSDNIAEPAQGVYTNNFGGKNLYGDYGSNTRMRRNGEIKTWAGYAFEGPGRYMELWASTIETGSCTAAPYAYGWNDVSDDRNTIDNSFYPSTNATMKFNMLCSNLQNIPSNCGCELEVVFEAAYQSTVRAQAEINSNFNIFCLNNHEAFASAEDYVMLAHGTDDLDGDFEVLAFNINNQYRECGMDYVGPGVDDIVALGLYIFAATKGASIAAGISSIPVLSTGIQVAYGQYASNGVNSVVSSVFDSEWRDFSGNCGGDIFGRTEGLTPFGNTYRGSIMLRPNEINTIILGANSRLRVGGQRRWDANARVLSSYRLTSMIRPATSDGTPYDDLCCSPAAVTYTMSTRDGASGSARVSSSNWQLQVESFLNLYGLSHDVRGEVGKYLGPNPAGCNSNVSIIINKDASNTVTSKLTINEISNVQLERKMETTETLRIMSVDGRIVHEADISQQVDQRLQLRNISPGVYFVSVIRKDGSVFSTKTVLL